MSASFLRPRRARLARVVFSGLIIAFAPAFAEPLTPAAAARLALANNPELVAARGLVAEVEARASGMGRLPNPELETEFAAGARERGRIEVGLSQRFPRTARLRLERKVAAEAVALARLEIAVREAEIAARAQAAVLDLAAARAGLGLVEKQAALAREFAEAQAGQAAEGQLSALVVAQARFAARETEFGLAERRAEEALAVGALAAVLGGEADATFEVDANLALPPEAPSPSGLGPRGDLALAERALAAGDAEVSLARASGREDYIAGVFVEGEQERDALGDRERELLVGLRFSVPLPVRDVAAPAVAEKQAARRRLVLERDALAFAARSEVAASGSVLRSRHAAALALANELLPAAREFLAATSAAHARGEAEFSDIFRARERLAEVERADLAARHTYHLALVRHLAATGHLTIQP